VPEIFSRRNPRKYFCPLPHFYGPAFLRALIREKWAGRKNLKTVTPLRPVRQY